MNMLVRDIRYAFRTLARGSGFAIMAIIVIALSIGIGSNSALFSVVNAVLLKPLPYTDSHQFMQIQRSFARGKFDAVSTPYFLYWRDANTVFDLMATHDGHDDRGRPSRHVAVDPRSGCETRDGGRGHRNDRGLRAD